MLPRTGGLEADESANLSLKAYADGTGVPATRTDKILTGWKKFAGKLR